MPESTAPHADFGEHLRQAREQRGISLRQVAAATKISINALEALERNDVSRLPGGIFSRAFVRSYASEIGLDPEASLQEFLARFPDEGAAAKLGHVDLAEENEGANREMAGVLLKLAGIGIPVTLAVVYFSLSSGGSASSPMADPPAAVAAEQTDAVAEGSGSATGAPAPLDPRAVTGAVVSRESEVVASDGGVVTMEIRPRGPCWISMTVDGERVLSRVVNRGERLVQQAAQEIRLDIGDAGQFAYTINGRPGRSLGRSGEVVRVRIDLENYRDYLGRSPAAFGSDR